MGVREINLEEIKRSYTLEAIYRITQAAQATLDMDELFFIILTYVTAGGALRFSRAMLFLLDEEKNILEGKMGIGPVTKEEAYRIWGELTKFNIPLEELVRSYRKTPASDSSFNKLVSKTSIPLDLPDEACSLSLKNKRAYKITHPLEEGRVAPSLKEILKSDEVVIAPIISREKALGIVLADNAFRDEPISENQVYLLTIFTNQIGQAVENARSYQALRETQERLVRSEKLAAIGKTVASIAHAIRNPLVTIGGFSHLLLEDLESGKKEKVKRSLSIIRDEVLRLEKALSELLDFSHSVKPSLSFCQINKIIEDCCLFLKGDLAKKEITLSLNLSPELDQILADSLQLTRVFLDIIENAISSMGSGGLLKIETSKEKEELRVEFTDSGCGIPQENLSNIFQPFHTTKEGHWGLGLALSQEIVEAHKGYIAVRSEGDGKGAVFTIHLPIRK